LDDAPEVQGEWQPKNSHEGFSGAVRLREDLARSLNLPAVKLITDLGPDVVVNLAKRLGIKSDLESVPSLVLGSSSVTPLEMTSVYATIANHGTRVPPRIINKITDPDGAEIPLIGNMPEQVVLEQEAYIITSMMTSVIKGGTGSKAQKLGRPVAGKTGTSNDQKDAWFVGFTPDFASAVWIGYDNPKSIGRREYGGRAALPIWLNFMETAHKGLPKSDFEIPEGIVEAKIDPESGLLAYAELEKPLNEVFIEGTEPTEIAVSPELVDPNNFLMDEYLEPDAGTSEKP